MLDTSAPKITSFSLLENEYEVGDTIQIQYAANDATGVDYVIFSYYDEANILRRVGGSVEEGIASLEIDETFVSGQYDLSRITVKDTSALGNYASYENGGTVMFDDTSWKHDFDFTNYSFTVLDSVATLTFASELYDRSGEAISGFQLSTSSGSETETYDVTGGAGSFDWSSTPGATVEFVSETAYSNLSKAVTSADALDALKLSVALTPSNGTPNAYDYIAADFNRDGKVTSSDALDILKYAVGLEVVRDAEWVFIRSDDDLSAVGKNSVEYDTNILIEDITSDATIGLTGILIGDVNDSYSGLIA